MDPEIDDVPELSEHYEIDDREDHWFFTCKVCHDGFTFSRGADCRAFRSLLLAHAKTHHAPVEEEVDRA